MCLKRSSLIKLLTQFFAIMRERLSMVRSKWTLFSLVVSLYIFISVHVVYYFNVFFRCYNATFLTRISVNEGKIMTRLCELDVFSHLYTNGVSCKEKHSV